MELTNSSRAKAIRVCLMGVSALIIVLVGCYLFIRTGGNSGDEGSESSQGSASAIDMKIVEDDIDWASLPEKEIALDDSQLDITDPGTYILTGTSTAGVVVDAAGPVKVVLNNAAIESSDGAAIEVTDAVEVVVIATASDTTNKVSDVSTRDDDDVSGVIYSETDLILSGEGALQVTSAFEDGIASKKDLTVASGTLSIDSVDEGMRGKDSLAILGGTITVNAADDGIKASNDEEAEKGYLYISGGTITISSGDDAVKAEASIVIDGGVISVEESVEGIEAAVIIISGGSFDVYSSDDGINASESNFNSSPAIEINGGNVEVEVGSGDTDAIDSNGDIFINGGTVSLVGNSTIDYDGVGEFNDGVLIVNGEQTDELPEQMMGGGPPRS